MALIALTRGLFATVDDADADWLGQWKWNARQGGGGFYAARSNKTIYMHRVILQASPGALCDHANGDSLDNRRANLRLCLPHENSRNRRSRCTAASEYKGITRAGGKFRAQIEVASRHISLGCFDTPEEAAAAYDAAALRLHGEFARINGTP